MRLYGGTEEAHPSFVVQSRASIESALALPHQPYYETFADKSAALTRSIACNHGLVDGNKRLAVTVLKSALLSNGYIWLWSDDDAEAAILRLAEGDSDFRWLPSSSTHSPGKWAYPGCSRNRMRRTRSKTVMRDIQDEYVATLYVAIEGALQHIHESHGEEWEEALDALEEELTPQQFVQRWREAISAMASGPLPEAPAVVRGLRSLIDIVERSGGALVVVSPDFEAQ